MIQPFAYPLRPGKFVDRALFVELLQHIDRESPIREAVYVGFGGPCMEDHRVIHAALGLKQMVSIERGEHIFAQQKFNRPLREIVCVRADAKDFIDEFAARLESVGIDSDRRKIVWLDYDEAGALVSQLNSLQALIGLANDGDIIRITLNASAGTLGNKHENEGQPALQARRMVRLREIFGDFLPEGLTLDATLQSGYPDAVIGALKLAALRATSNSERTFLPLLVVHYADGQAMVTATGIVLDERKSRKFVDQTGLLKWPYYSNTWKNVERVLHAPALTMRERLHMDQALMVKRNVLPDRLNFLTAIHKRTGLDLVKTYRRYQRFFPRFQHVDM